MPGRWLSLWLPSFPIDRMRLETRRRGEAWPDGAAFALLAEDRGAQRVTAVDANARSLGVREGLSLSDARAILPGLRVRDADPAADAAALDALALWCGRYSPRVALDGPDGVMVDIAGCGHLFGGERALLDDLSAHLGRWNIAHHVALADRQASAWAWARFGTGRILPPVKAPAALRELPTAALRIDAAAVADLARLGLRRVGQVAELPASTLLARFDPTVVDRLEALLGDAAEPFVPLREKRAFAARLAWPEPIGRTADLSMALLHLLRTLVQDLEGAELGARLVEAHLSRIDGAVATLRTRTSAATRDAKHLHRLLSAKLDGLDVGFGIELMVVEILETAPLSPRQVGLGAERDPGDLMALVDQLGMRLGPERVRRLEPVDSHVPERAERLVPAATQASGNVVAGLWRESAPRPLVLFDAPLEVDAVAMLPDSPPVRLRDRKGSQAVLQGTGPERIAPEWWKRRDRAARSRDYYRLRTADGRDLWSFREGAYDDAEPPRWRVQGLFD